MSFLFFFFFKRAAVSRILLHDELKMAGASLIYTDESKPKLEEANGSQNLAAEVELKTGLGLYFYNLCFRQKYQNKALMIGCHSPALHVPTWKCPTDRYRTEMTE